MGWLFGGGSSTTSVELPDWLEEDLQGLLGGATDRFSEYADILGNLGLERDPESGLPRFLTNMTRGTAPMDYWENQAGRLAGGLTAGSPEFGEAANLLRQNARLNQYERETNRLAGVYANPEASPYESKKATEYFNRLAGAGSTPVDFAGYEADPLFQQQMKAFEQTVAPQIRSAATSMGLGRSGAAAAGEGYAKTGYTRNALQDYLAQKNANRAATMQGYQGAGAGLTRLGEDIRGARAQNLQTRMGLGSELRAGREAAAGGLYNIGSSMHQRKLDAINALAEMGQRRREINQSRNDANWEENMRKLAAFESALTGPLGMIPGMTGATTVQRKKNKG